MKKILTNLVELKEHPDKDDSIFEAASAYLRDANELAVSHGIKPVCVFPMTNPIEAIAIVNRFIIEMEPERFLLVKDAAKILSVSQDKVSEWIAANRLEAVNVANPGKRPQYRIPMDALRNLKPERAYKPKHL